MQDFTISKRLDNNKVLITEQKKNVPQSNKKYYIASEDKADKFINSMKRSDDLNSFQKVATTALSVLSGLYVGHSMKASPVSKLYGGVAAAAGIYLGAHKLDVMVDKQARTNNIKHFEVEDISDDTKRVDEALNYSEPDVKETDAKEVENKESEVKDSDSKED